MVDNEKGRALASEDGKGARASRGTGFPIMPLPEAVRIIRAAGQHRVDHTKPAFAQYMGHTTVNSGSFLRRLAAMKDWGLVTTSGDRVVLTQLGRAIAFPTSNEAERLQLQEAFRYADAFAQMLDDLLPHGQPVSQDVVANTAAKNLGVTPASREKFAQSFRESALFAGLAREVGPDAIELIDGGGTAEVSHTGELPVDDREDSGASKVASPLERTSGGMRPVVSPVWPVSGGEVLFEVRLDRPMPARAWAQIGTVTAAIEDLVNILGVGAQELGGDE